MRLADPVSERSGTWTRPVHDAVRVDRSKLAAVPAARCALGIAIPLVVGDFSGHLLVGVGGAVGALTAGMASLQGTYRSRVKIMAFAAAAFAVSAFAGATVGHLQGPDIVVTAVWGIAAGLLVMFGEAPGVVGLQAVIGLVVFSQFSFSAEQAALNALWALCGGAIQIVLVAVTWPLQRFPVERAMSSDAYRQLAAHLRSLVSDPSTLLDPGVLDKLRSALVETQPWATGPPPPPTRRWPTRRSGSASRWPASPGLGPGSPTSRRPPRRQEGPARSKPPATSRTPSSPQPTCWPASPPHCATGAAPSPTPRTATGTEPPSSTYARPPTPPSLRRVRPSAMPSKD